MWDAPTTYDVATGLLSTLGAGYTTRPTGDPSQDVLGGLGPASAYPPGPAETLDTPAAGQGFWWLLRASGPLGSGGSGACNDLGLTWGSAGRDSVLP